MHKIAIVKVSNEYSDYDKETVRTSITDWTEVSDEDYKILMGAAQSSHGANYFMVLEQPVNVGGFVANTVEAHLKIAKANEARRKAEVDKRKKEAEKKKAIADAKKATKEKNELEALLKKNGLIAIPAEAPMFVNE